MAKFKGRYFVVKTNFESCCTTAREIRDDQNIIGWGYGALIKRVGRGSFRWWSRNNAREDMRDYKKAFPLKKGWKYAIVRETGPGTFKFC